MWINILEIAITILLFLCASYLLYYKAFLKAFGKETAKLLTVEEYTRLQEEVKEEYNQRLAELKADLDQKNSEFTIQYTLLHTKRAEVIVEVNRLLSALLKNVEIYTNAFIPGSTDKDQLDVLNDRLSNLNKSYDLFMAYYDYNKLFFKKSFCETIDSLLIDIIDVCRKQNGFYQRTKTTVQSVDDEEFLNRTFEEISNNLKLLRESKYNLENEFRSLLCVE